MLLTGKTMLAGVIGWPVRHSCSPCLHSWWLERYGIDGVYVPLSVQPTHFTEVIRTLGRAGFRGVNITVPYKEIALAAVDKATSLAYRVGAVNTVVYTDNGYLLGSNTDGFGFIENLREYQPSWHASDGLAVVIGAGGAARAIVTALVENNIPRLLLTNRSRQRAEVLAANINRPIEVVDWLDRAEALEGATLLVNATSLGMKGMPPLELDLKALPPTALVADVVYIPPVTPLLSAATARGNPIVDGIGMLLHQARPGFNAWFGVEPEVTTDLRALVRKQTAFTDELDL